MHVKDLSTLFIKQKHSHQPITLQHGGRLQGECVCILKVYPILGDYYPAFFTDCIHVKHSRYSNFNVMDSLRFISSCSELLFPDCQTGLCTSVKKTQCLILWTDHSCQDYEEIYTQYLQDATISVLYESMTHTILHIDYTIFTNELFPSGSLSKSCLKVRMTQCSTCGFLVNTLLLFPLPTPFTSFPKVLDLRNMFNKIYGRQIHPCKNKKRYNYETRP